MLKTPKHLMGETYLFFSIIVLRKRDFYGIFDDILKNVPNKLCTPL